jgi:hypothetical protein
MRAARCGPSRRSRRERSRLTAIPRASSSSSAPGETDPQTAGPVGWTQRRRVIDVALVVPAILIIAGWLTLAVIHLDDRYEVGHGQGVWMALAREADVSGLYPEVFDGTSYGGTRYMPLPIFAHAAIARLTGEYLTSGKLLGVLATAGLVVVAFFVLQGIGCRWPWSLALSALTIGGYAGLRAGTTIGGEPLPVIFGVIALAMINRSRRHPALIGAALLSALSIGAKLSAVWVPVAIIAWLLVTDRRRATPFAGYVVGATVLLLGAFELMSDGRMGENLVAVWGAGLQGTIGFVKAPARLLDFLVNGEIAVWALIPVLAYGASTRRLSITRTPFPMAWMAAASLLIFTLADIGTGPNQLLDVAVLTALCAGTLVASVDPADARSNVIVMIVAGIVIWSGVTAFIVRIRPPLQDAAISVLNGSDPYPRDILDEQLSTAASVLSEDPGVLVEHDREPVVLDPFMLRKLAETRPGEVEQLVQRVRQQEFELVVLVVPLQDPEDPWWRDYHFGTDVITAVNDAYELDQRVDGFYLYRPRV